MTNHASRYWTWTRAELEEYFGIREGQRSHYIKGKDFEPSIMSVVQPKQLHDTERHPGTAIPVKMDGSGRHIMKPAVDKMLAGIPYAIMRQAVDHIGQKRPELVSTVRVLATRKPLETNEMIADSIHIDQSTLYRRINLFLDAVDQYLDCYGEGWPEGSAV